MKKSYLLLLGLVGCSNSVKYSGYEEGVVRDVDLARSRVLVMNLESLNELEIVVYGGELECIELEKGVRVSYPTKLWGQPIFGRERIGLLNMDELRTDAFVYND
jgi:hypothetical protein